jgi:protein subunit release factor B
MKQQPNKQDFEQFTKQVYEETKALFPEGAIEVFVARCRGPGSDEPLSAAVRLVHTATGISVDCDQYSSQRLNLIAATIQLRIACDKKTA